MLAEAKHLAAQYDYDKAIAAVTGFAGWENVPELQQAKADFEAQKAQAVRYADPTTIPHIFFHTLIADTARAFDGDPEQGGYNQFMATIKEFNAVLQSLYERGFVLVDIHDVAGPQQQADGSTKYVAGDIYLPAGKKAHRPVAGRRVLLRIYDRQRQRRQARQRRRRLCLAPAGERRQAHVRIRGRRRPDALRQLRPRATAG